MKTNNAIGSERIHRSIAILEDMLRGREKTVAIAFRWLHVFGKCAPKEKTERVARHVRELIPSINIIRADIRGLKALYD